MFVTFYFFIEPEMYDFSIKTDQLIYAPRAHPARHMVHVFKKKQEYKTDAVAWNTALPATTEETTEESFVIADHQIELPV